MAVAPEAFQELVGAQIPARSPKIFLLCPLRFRGAPMTGHYRKVHGTVTRTELGQKWQRMATATV